MKPPRGLALHKGKRGAHPKARENGRDLPEVPARRAGLPATPENR
jgi:hypothetical protein